MDWPAFLYEYDGSYAGLLCCVFDSYTRKETPAAIVPLGEGQCSFYPLHAVKTDAAHARRISDSLRRRSKEASLLCRRAFLTCLPEKELLIYRLIVRLYEEGPAFLKNPTDPQLYPLHTAVRHLATELEKFRGFVRFSEFSGIYVAEIAPKNRVLPALRGHFCARFADQDFLIYDRTHKEALLSSAGHWRIAPLDSFEMAQPDRFEAQYRRLWKTFFDTISIRERTNPRCQRTHMPLRYRSTLTEFQPESFFIPREDALPGAAAPSLPRDQ